tara:strand:- start:1018 stop:1641 length:624 start_codon:yes stop_codon:yes gene_type:complete
MVRYLLTKKLILVLVVAKLPFGKTINLKSSTFLQTMDFWLTYFLIFNILDILIPQVMVIPENNDTIIDTEKQDTFGRLSHQEEIIYNINQETFEHPSHQEIYTSSTMITTKMIYVKPEIYSDDNYENYTFYIPRLSKENISYTLYNNNTIAVYALKMKKLNHTEKQMYYILSKEYYSFIYHYNRNISTNDITSLYENNTYSLSIAIV